MKKIFFLIFWLVLCSQKTHSQDTLSLNYRNLFLELGGNGGLFSINYENKLFRFGKSRLNWDAGFSLVPMSGRAIIDFPFSINFLIGIKKNKAELGTGQTLILDLGGGKGGTIRGTFRLGYRYENKNHYWRLAYTPFYSYIYNFQYEHWIGISYGHYFKK